MVYLILVQESYDRYYSYIPGFFSCVADKNKCVPVLPYQIHRHSALQIKGDKRLFKDLAESCFDQDYLFISQVNLKDHVLFW